MSQYLLETVWLVPGYALLGGLLALPWSPGIIKRTGPRPAGYVNLITTFFGFFTFSNCFYSHLEPSS